MLLFDGEDLVGHRKELRILGHPVSIATPGLLQLDLKAFSLVTQSLEALFQVFLFHKGLTHFLEGFEQYLIEPEPLFPTGGFLLLLSRFGAPAGPKTVRQAAG